MSKFLPESAVKREKEKARMRVTFRDKRKIVWLEPPGVWVTPEQAEYIKSLGGKRD